MQISTYYTCYSKFYKKYIIRKHTDAGVVTAREISLFSSFLQKFFNFLGIECNYYFKTFIAIERALSSMNKNVFDFPYPLKRQYLGNLTTCKHIISVMKIPIHYQNAWIVQKAICTRDVSKGNSQGRLLQINNFIKMLALTILTTPNHMFIFQRVPICLKFFKNIL